MALTKRNLKGFVFTLDSIFALIVAMSSISILLYVHFTNSYLYLSPASEASSVLQNLLQTSAVDASGNIYARYMLNSWGGNAYTWPQFSHDQYQSSNTSSGPQTAYLLYSFKAAATITPVVAVDYGVAVFAAGTYLYAINATTGSVSSTYPLILAPTIPVAPVIYKNEIIYATSTGYINAVSISNSLVQLWSTNIGPAATTPLEIENNYLVFCSGDNVFLLNPTNGTSAAAVVTLPTSSPAQPPAYVNGEFIISTGKAGLLNYVYSYVLAGNVLTNVWSDALTTSQTTQPIVNGSAIAVGSGSNLYVLSLSGSLIKLNMLPNAQIVGIASSINNFYVETTSAIYSFAPSGSTIFSYPTQSDNQNSTPSASLPMLYTLVSGTNFQGYNTQTGLNVWNVSLPSASTYTGYSSVAIAYGNAYVANGNTLYVFGTYEAQPSDSLLQSIAGMYLNNQSAYSNLLLNKLYNSTNTGIFINGTYAPSLKTASFNGQSSYISTGTAGLPTGNSLRTVAVWIDPGSISSTEVFYFYGINAASQPNGYGAYVTSAYKIEVEFDSGNGAVISNKVLSPNTWYFVAATYNGVTSTVYINGVPDNSISYSSANTLVGTSDIGVWGSLANWFNGLIANLQVYSTVLTPPQVMQLYQAGQFGMPINATSLVGWWPLNGDFNDYSGHFNLGIPTNVIYQNSNVLPASLKNAFQISKATAPLSITSNGVSKLYNVSVVLWK